MCHFIVSIKETFKYTVFLTFFMSLRNLLNELDQQIGNRKLESSEQMEFNEALKGRIKVPEGFSQVERSYISLNAAGGYNNSPRNYHLSIKGTFNGANLVELVTRVFEDARKVDLDYDGSKISYAVKWDPDSFLALEELPVPFGSSLVIRRTLTSVDSLKTRMEGHVDTSRWGIELYQWKADFNVTGGYKAHSSDLARNFGSRYRVNITLSPRDGKRLEARIAQLPKIVQKIVSAQVKDAKATEFLGIQIGQDPEAGTKKIRATPRDYEAVRKMLQKPIATDNNGTGVSFEKQYLPWNIWRGRHLHSLQGILRQADAIDFGIIYGTPIITRDQAKEHLERELAELNEGFSTLERHRTSEKIELWSSEIKRFTHLIGGDEMMHLVEDYPSQPLRSSKDVVREDEFAQNLKKFGYIPQEILEVPSMYSQRVFPGAIRFISRTVAREAHLVHLATQKFRENPEPFIEDYVKDYVNQEPKTEIKMSSDVPGRKLRNLNLPQNSQLVDLNIERWFRISHPKYSYKDRLLIGGRSDGNVLFVSESTVSDPVLLDLQERALERLGIEVN